MNNLDFNLFSPDISPAIKLHHFIPSSFVEFLLRSTTGSFGRGEESRNMATTSKNMNVFYRQKKNSSASTGKKSTKSPSPKHAATFGSDITQPPALVSHGGSLDLKDDFDEQEQVLRQFDMNMAYGPCVGITRLDRWERAQRMGLNPPKEIESLLRGGKVKLESLFDGRV